jgi:hypothetical protein
VIFQESAQCKGKSVREIYDICESGLIYGDEIWEVRGRDQKSLIEFRRIFLRGFQGCQEKQQRKQQNGNLVEYEEEERCFLTQ